MTQVQINYHAESDTFVGDDGFGNQITFKSNRENNEIAQSSSGKSLGPMMSLLLACGACSGIDIVLILEKQRQEFDGLMIKVIGEREHDKTPALWKSIKVEYYLTGNIDLNKAEKAADLSVNKYCSVLETLRRASAEVSFEVFINSTL